MELKQFVKSSLLQVMEGVAEAQDVCASNGQNAVINPCPRLKPDQDKGFGPLQFLEFDVAVTVNSEAGIDGGIMIAGIGAKGQAVESTSSISRIKFKIPTRLPVKANI